MKNFNEDAFLADVSGICWELLLTETDDINTLVNNWSNLLSLIIEKHAPITEMRVSEKYCPWIDKDLRDLMQTRDKLKKVASKRKSQFLMDSYRPVRNKVNSRNIQLKKQYFTDKISTCHGNMKESWKAVNELLNKATFTLLRFHFYPFLLMKTLPVHIAPFSNRYAMKTKGVHIAPAKRCC